MFPTSFNNDFNLLSVLNYAVDVLKVKHVIVCGHYGCGGVKASMTPLDSGVLEHWLSNIRDVHRLHLDELNAIKDEEARFRRLVELNVVEQCVNLFKTSVVRKSVANTGFPLVHGLVYDIADGVLHELDLPLREYSEKLEDVYDFNKDKL